MLSPFYSNHQHIFYHSTKDDLLLVSSKFFGLARTHTSIPCAVHVCRCVHVCIYTIQRAVQRAVCNVASSDSLVDAPPPPPKSLIYHFLNLILDCILVF